MVLFAPIRVNDDFTAFSIHDEQPLDAANPSASVFSFLIAPSAGTDCVNFAALPRSHVPVPIAMIGFAWLNLPSALKAPMNRIQGISWASSCADSALHFNCSIVKVFGIQWSSSAVKKNSFQIVLL